MRLHVYVWEQNNGKVPSGYHVHHIDEDKNNNEIENLMLLHGIEHVIKHSKNLTEEERERRRKNVIQKANPKASEWHRSSEGRKWHEENGKESWKNRKEIIYTCDFCGKEFESRKVYAENQNKFCSNNCKSANRRKSGVDNVIKICEKCGNEYLENKYSKTTKCKVCRNKKN